MDIISAKILYLLGSPRCSKLFGSVHMPVCMNSNWKRAPFFCAFFATIFGHFFISKLFLTENEKVDANSKHV